MGILEEYINSLEGQENLDPLTVASKMHELSVQEISTREAKIAELNDSIAEKDGVIATREGEIRSQKAMNFDLAMQIPGTPADPQTGGQESSIDGGTITIDDLFAKKG